MNWNQRGKILFSEAWFKNKEKFRNYLQTHQQEEYAEEYIDLLKALIEVVINPELEEKLRIRSKKLNNLLADGKDVYDKKEWKYYRKAITEDCPKPYWRNI